MHQYLFILILLFNLACQKEHSQEQPIINVNNSAIIIDHTTTDLQKIPLQWIDSAKAKLHIRYGHASHGSQITLGGMTALTRFSDKYNVQYAYGPEIIEKSLHLIETDDELSHYDNWDILGREYLDNHPECNVVIWSWCGILSKDIDYYLATMEALITEYGPRGSKNRKNPVQFVFMTSHVYGYTGNKEAYEANKRIRTYCMEKGRILLDFNDIECYDPDGNYYGDGNPDGSYSGARRLNDDMSYDNIYKQNRGNWGVEWIAKNPDSYLTMLAQDNTCTICPHSMGEGNDANSRLHCVLKGIAAWWLWARLSGWDGQVS